MTANVLPAQPYGAFSCTGLASYRASTAIGACDGNWRFPVSARVGGEADSDYDGRGDKRG